MKFMDVFRERFLTLSNLLSVLRLFLIPPFFYVSRMYRENVESPGWAAWLFAIIATAVITDFFDGYLARIWNQTTMLGRYLDPVADKAVTLTGLLVITLYYDFPAWAFCIVVVREILGVWLGWFLYFKRNMQGRPNQWGKWGVGVVAVTVAWHMATPILAKKLDADSVFLHSQVSAYILAFFYVAGMAAYIHTYKDIVLGRRTPQEPPP